MELDFGLEIFLTTITAHRYILCGILYHLFENIFKYNDEINNKKEFFAGNFLDMYFKIKLIRKSKGILY